MMMVLMMLLVWAGLLLLAVVAVRWLFPWSAAVPRENTAAGRRAARGPADGGADAQPVLADRATERDLWTREARGRDTHRLPRRDEPPDAGA